MQRNTSFTSSIRRAHEKTPTSGAPWTSRRTWSAQKSIQRHGWAGVAKGSAAPTPDAVRAVLPAAGGAKERPTIIFLDWDDTLLPTSHLKSYGAIDDVGNLVKRPDHELELEVLELQRGVVQLLRAATAVAERVSIVTSASEGWVENSARNFVPDGEVTKLIAESGITVRHARDPAGSNNPARWKADAMWEELAPLRWGGQGSADLAEDEMVESDAEDTDSSRMSAQNKPVRIISIGDSIWERTAAGVVAREQDVLVTVKLKSGPSTCALRKQLERVRQALPSLVGAAQSAEINAVAADGRRASSSQKRAAGSPGAAQGSQMTRARSAAKAAARVPVSA
jgi:hypothetical protein